MRPARSISSAALAGALAAVLGATVAAEARPRKPHHGRALTVNKRPFTDSGNVVNVGTQSRYVYDSQPSGHSMTLGVAPNSYGGETLPGRFELPGNRPLFNF